MTGPCGIVVTVAALVLAVGAGAGPASRPVRIGEYLDAGRRVLVVMAKSDTDPAFVEQRKGDRDQAAAYAERDVVVVYVTGDDATADGKPLPAGTAAGIRSGLDDGDPFVVILFGKDKGVKLRERKPVPAERVVGLIDSMPMRQREAAERAK